MIARVFSRGCGSTYPGRRFFFLRQSTRTTHAGKGCTSSCLQSFLHSAIAVCVPGVTFKESQRTAASAARVVFHGHELGEPGVCLAGGLLGAGVGAFYGDSLRAMAGGGELRRAWLVFDGCRRWRVGAPGRTARVICPILIFVQYLWTISENGQKARHS